MKHGREAGRLQHDEARVRDAAVVLKPRKPRVVATQAEPEDTRSPVLTARTFPDASGAWVCVVTRVDGSTSTWRAPVAAPWLQRVMA